MKTVGPMKTAFELQRHQYIKLLDQTSGQPLFNKWVKKEITNGQFKMQDDLDEVLRFARIFIKQ